jgi:hypothetical protein
MLISICCRGDFNGCKVQTTSMASAQEAVGAEVDGEVNCEETRLMSRDSRLVTLVSQPSYNPRLKSVDFS